MEKKPVSAKKGMDLRKLLLTFEHFHKNKKKAMYVLLLAHDVERPNLKNVYYEKWMQMWYVPKIAFPNDLLNY